MAKAGARKSANQLQSRVNAQPTTIVVRKRPDIIEPFKSCGRIDNVFTLFSPLLGQYVLGP